MDEELIQKANEYKKQIAILYAQAFDLTTSSRDSEIIKHHIYNHPNFVAFLMALKFTNGSVWDALDVVGIWSLRYHRVFNSVVMTGKADFPSEDIVEYLQVMPYKDYLHTAHWLKTRQEALKRAGNRCQVCGRKKSLNVHHNSYERRGEEMPEDLIVLCKECHQLYHERNKLPPPPED